jgi:AcrR family transcriptional regulator
VSVRDITAAAGVNLASVNYHFGSKDALLFDIFGRRTAELNRDRARMLHEANDRHGGKPPVREILTALCAPPLKWLAPANDRRISLQFLIRARSEGTEKMREALRTDVSHLRRFSDALIAAMPDLPAEEVYWRVHFVLGMIHQNRFAELDRLNVLSEGLTHEEDVEALLKRMVDFAEAGFLA